VTLSDSEWLAVLTSLRVALRALAFTLPPAVLLGWLLARRRFPGRALLDALVHSPLILPPVVVGYLLLLIFGVQGPVGRWLDEVFGLRLVFSTNGAALAAGIVSRSRPSIHDSNSRRVPWAQDRSIASSA
jgi:molybdate transport system permease protein